MANNKILELSKKVMFLQEDYKKAKHYLLNEQENLFNQITNIVTTASKVWDDREKEITSNIEAMAAKRNFKFTEFEYAPLNKDEILFALGNLLPIYNQNCIRIDEYKSSWNDVQIRSLSIKEYTSYIEVIADFGNELDGFEVYLDNEMLNEYYKASSDTEEYQAISKYLDTQLQKKYKHYDDEFSKNGTPFIKTKDKKARLAKLKEEVAALESELDGPG